MPLPKDVKAYNASRSGAEKRICDTLAKLIDEHLPTGGKHGELENKVWHRHPVWFLDGNPIVGYDSLKDGVRLMFWSGESFDEPGLPKDPPDSKFKSAGVRYTDVKEINAKDLKRWLTKSANIQWDYKNIVKRKGRLDRLK